VTIAPSSLVWDFAASRSNYVERFAAAIDDAGGRAWVSEHSDRFDWLTFTTDEDIEVAQVGLTTPTITRLRTTMLVDHLEQDLELEPAGDPSYLSNLIQVEAFINEPERTCPEWPRPECPGPWQLLAGNGCIVGSGAPSPWAPLAVVAGVVAVALVRRRR
jgi:MYXO-CTERM domain-containing protein